MITGLEGLCCIVMLWEARIHRKDGPSVCGGDLCTVEGLMVCNMTSMKVQVKEKLR